MDSSKNEIRQSMILGGCVGFGVAMGHLAGSLIFGDNDDSWTAKVVGGLICIVVATVAYQLIKAKYRPA